ncbi:hypothetical protein ACEWY4_004441 [Coilia grayii]|uniref:PLAT domain-containing protein n=1 Tax=Coilia grayii TaxID=363190 RepID=A0ABD1KLN6_9TELE
MTGDICGAGTNSKIHLTMFGKKGLTNSGKVFLEGGEFERAQIDTFNLEICTLLSPLSRVTIGHDNLGISCGWHCEQVTVYCPFTGIEQVFPCSKWLDEDEGDKLVERELYEMVSLRKVKQIKHPWSIWIYTSDIKGAGTDAQIYIQVYGEKGKSDVFPMISQSDSFESGYIDKFMVEMVDVGPVRKLRIWHEKRNPFSGWHLHRVTAMNMLTKERYKFECGRWLAITEEDEEIIRELPATGPLVQSPLPLMKYRVVLHTGTVFGAGTDACVFICLYGDLGDTGDRYVFQSLTNGNKFEKGKADEFLIEAVSLGPLRRIRISHDGTGAGSGWFLDKITIREDGQTEAEAMVFPYVKYHISCTTGTLGGSDSKVWVKLYGEKGDTHKCFLLVSDNNLPNYFEKGQTDIFTLETYDLGKINRLLIGHTNEGVKSGWFLDSVLISVPVHGVEYMFPAHRWLSTSESDGKTEVEIYPSQTLEIEKLINYEVTVVTGDRVAAGTNANVFIQIYGFETKTELEALDVDRIFKIRIGHDGTKLASGWYIEKVLVKRLIWALVPIEKKAEEAKEDKKDKKKKKKKKKEDDGPTEEWRDVVQTYSFTCERWLARDEEDGEIVVELRADDYEDLEANTYQVYVYTRNLWGAGTDAKVFLNIYGEYGDTGERHLWKSDHINKFESGQVDEFVVKAIDLGTLTKLRIRHDNSGLSPSWFLDQIIIFDVNEETTYHFPCQRWLAVGEDDGQLMRELVPVDAALCAPKGEASEDAEGEEGGPPQVPNLGLEQKAMTTTYNLKIKTGIRKHSGTDANVYVILYGTKDDTGIIALKRSKTHTNKFELGMTDEFSVEAVNLGQLKRIRIGHDNKGLSPGWFLDWVEVDAPSLGELLVFPCGRWLSKKKEDGIIFRDLRPNPLQTQHYEPFVPYEIKVYTTDIFAGGTDADVFIVLYGSDGVCTSKKSLCLNKRERSLSFKRASCDVFVLEMEDTGDLLEKIRIGHDSSGMASGWHLDRVEVRRLLRKGKGSETTIFPYEGWLATSEEDGETIRELEPDTVITEKLKKDGTLMVTEVEVSDALLLHTYRVTVKTGDLSGAGTDACVFLTIYGDLGDTGERYLSYSSNNSNKFERGAEDEFELEAVDLGLVYKIRIRHDNSMLRPDWYLQEVKIVDMDTEEEAMFMCERWLSAKKEDMKIERVFYVKGYEGPRGEDSKPVLDSNMNQMKEEEEEDTSLIPYHFTVMTGDDPDAGTNSRAFIIIHGREISTERMWLEREEGKDFEPEGMDHFECLGVDVEDIKGIGHDGAAPESCWMVLELTVDVPTHGVRLVFRCKCWLAKDRGDGLTTRLLHVMDAEVVTIVPKIIYEITMTTGDEQNAGTDSQLYVTVFGVNGTTMEIPLPKNGDRLFERAQVDSFNIEVEDIAPLRMIRIRSDGAGSRPHYLLEQVVLRNLLTGDVAEFTYNEWLSLTMGEKKLLSAEMAAVIDGEAMVEPTNYIIKVKTGECMGAGTDANVWIVVFGENGDTGPLRLKHSDHRNKFERSQTDTFEFPDLLRLGNLSKVRLWHDNSGKSTTYTTVRDDLLDQNFRFPCKRWFSKNSEDGQLIRDLACANNDVLDLDETTKYEIITVTADDDEAETKENVTIILEGRKGRSKELLLENSGKHKRFLSGSTDSFEFHAKNVGDLVGVCVGHVPKDGKKPKGEAFWGVVEIIVIGDLGNKYIMACNAEIPLQSKKDEPLSFELTKMVESFASKARSLKNTCYDIAVVTGDEDGAGTDANVFLTLYGTNGDSGKKALRQKCRNLFERDKMERFTLELLEMGDLTHVIIEHDSTGIKPGWLLDNMEITNTSNNVSTKFYCGKWLDLNRADGWTRRMLYPKY